MKREEGDFRGAIEPDGKADGSDAAIDVKLHAAKMEETFNVLPSAVREDDWADEGEADLASVGVAGQHEVDQMAARVGEYVIGEVGGVAHEQDRAIGFPGNGEVKFRHLGYRIMHAAEPEALALALNRDVFVHKQRDINRGQALMDDGRAEEGVVVAHDGESLGTGDASEDFSATMHRPQDEATGQRSKADVVPRKEDKVWSHRVDVADNSAHEGGFGVLVEMNVAYLDDAKVVERIGQVVDGDGAGEDADLVAGEFA